MSDFERCLLKQMTTREGLAVVLGAKLRREVFEEPIARVIFDYIVDYWDKSEPKNAPVVEVIHTAFRGVALPEFVEFDTAWLITQIQKAYAANQLRQIMMEAATLSVASPVEAVQLLQKSLATVVDAMGYVGGGLLDRLSVDADWLDTQKFSSQQYVVHRLVSEGVRILAGPPKKGKSFLVGDLPLAVAQGGIALGAIEVIKRPVLYMALEDGHARLQGRLRMMNADQPLPTGLKLVIQATPDQALQVIAEYLDRYSAERPFVILDTLGKVKRAKRPGEEPYLVDYAMGVKLKEIADSAHGSSILVVHHSRKAGADDFVDTVSGTQGIAGSVDFVMVLNRKRHCDDATLHVTGRDIEEGEYALHAEQGTLWRLAGGDLAQATQAAEQRQDEVRLRRRSLEVLSYVNSREQTTAKDAMEALGLDRRQANQLLGRLHDSGKIAKPAYGMYAPRHGGSPSEGTEGIEGFSANAQFKTPTRDLQTEKPCDVLAPSEGLSREGSHLRRSLAEVESGTATGLIQSRTSSPSLPSFTSPPLSLDRRFPPLQRTRVSPELRFSR